MTPNPSMDPSVTSGRPSRRTFLQMLSGATLALAGCGKGPTEISNGSARLDTSPTAPTTSLAAGTWPLNLATGRDGYLLVPASYQSAVATPLLVLLHGAGGSGADMLGYRAADAEREGILALAVDSRSSTWDAMRGPYGVDVAFIADALDFAFSRCRVDPNRIILEGFSDGASYALGLGLANGDLFTHVVAFSPGFIPSFDGNPVGTPAFFIAHGTADTILPIDQTSRQIVPYLRDQGYEVQYVEHSLGHVISAAVAAEALAWSLS